MAIFALLFISTRPRANGLMPVTPPSAIRVSLTRTLKDWHDLADIRYNEWIIVPTETVTTNGKLSPISRQAFQRATVDIYKSERPNAVTFLARRGDDVIGGGELSPSELENAIYYAYNATTASTPAPKVLYVTDVVTDRRYRRQGIAAMLMREMESHAAAVLRADYLVLNVAKDNDAAFAFYKRLGYETAASDEFLQVCNVARLLKNAGTQGQETLWKRISSR
jgi:ribosomal protein S18 acetylase RimI-like enzyme